MVKVAIWKIFLGNTNTQKHSLICASVTISLSLMQTRKPAHPLFTGTLFSTNFQFLVLAKCAARPVLESRCIIVYQYSIFNIGRLCYFQLLPPRRPGGSWPWAGIPRGGELPVLQCCCNISKQAPQQTSSPRSLKQAPQRVKYRLHKELKTGPLLQRF